MLWRLFMNSCGAQPACSRSAFPSTSCFSQSLDKKHLLIWLWNVYSTSDLPFHRCVTEDRLRARLCKEEVAAVAKIRSSPASQVGQMLEVLLRVQLRLRSGWSANGYDNMKNIYCIYMSRLTQRGFMMEQLNIPEDGLHPRFLLCFS